jgi:predicted nucleic acid-binding Zn ribbon protein
MIDLPRKDVPERKEKNIADVMKRMNDRYHLTQKHNEIELVKHWETIVGNLIAKHTSNINIKGKTLYVSFDQAPLKNEMFLQRDALIQKVNEHMGAGFIEKIFIG